jgi:undecaprenyl-diphosphatase
VNKVLEWDARLSAGLRLAEQPGLLRTVAGILAHSGDSWFWLVGLGIVWASGSSYWKSRALALMIGILVTALIVLAIKFTVRRRRPEGEWGNIYRRTDPHSFPSGHAARAAMLVVMAANLGPPWLYMVLVPWALAVVLARVVMGVHYLSDVLAGAGLGLLIGALLVRLLPVWV